MKFRQINLRIILKSKKYYRKAYFYTVSETLSLSLYFK